MLTEFSFQTTTHGSGWMRMELGTTTFQKQPFIWNANKNPRNPPQKSKHAAESTPSTSPRWNKATKLQQWFEKSREY